MNAENFSNFLHKNPLEASKVVEAVPSFNSRPKSWIDIMVEDIDTMPKDIKATVNKKVCGIWLDPSEQSLLDRYRDKFWKEKFGVDFRVRDRSKVTGENLHKKIKQRRNKDFSFTELESVYKDFAEHFEEYVIYEDDSLLVLNKPPGITTQGASPQEPFSVANFIGTVRPGTSIVHRIDKETSGVLVLGKTPQARSALVKNWKNVEKEKWYVAISNGDYNESVVGSILPIEEKNSGAIVSKGPAKTSSTYFDKLMTFQKDGKTFSLLRIRIFSGRKHQIRVSLNHLGFPIVGDKLYNKKSRRERESDRHLLHAYKMRLVHPDTGKIMEFTAPLPEDMKKFLGPHQSDRLD